MQFRISAWVACVAACAAGTWHRLDLVPAAGTAAARDTAGSSGIALQPRWQQDRMCAPTTLVLVAAAAGAGGFRFEGTCVAGVMPNWLVLCCHALGVCL